MNEDLVTLQTIQNQILSRMVTALDAMSLTNQIKRFASTAQTITTGGALTLAHSLATFPIGVSLELRCLTSEAGYAVGDRVFMSTHQGTTAANRVNGGWFDDTNVYIRFSDQAGCFTAANKTTGAAAVLTNANWSLFVHAWA